MKLIQTKDYNVYKDYILSHINFIDDDDDTYVSDLQQILPKLFRDDTTVDEDENPDGYALPQDTISLLDLCYEGKGTLHKYYPDYFDEE